MIDCVIPSIIVWLLVSERWRDLDRWWCYLKLHIRGMVWRLWGGWCVVAGLLMEDEVNAVMLFKWSCFRLQIFVWAFICKNSYHCFTCVQVEGGACWEWVQFGLFCEPSNDVRVPALVVCFLLLFIIFVEMHLFHFTLSKWQNSSVRAVLRTFWLFETQLEF